jgi:hypothetical protein
VATNFRIRSNSNSAHSPTPPLPPTVRLPMSHSQYDKSKSRVFFYSSPNACRYCPGPHMMPLSPVSQPRDPGFMCVFFFLFFFSVDSSLISSMPLPRNARQRHATPCHAHQRLATTNNVTPCPANGPNCHATPGTPRLSTPPNDRQRARHVPQRHATPADGHHHPATTAHTTPRNDRQRPAMPADAPMPTDGHPECPATPPNASQ